MSNTHRYQVAISIINYNSSNHTLKCIESILAYKNVDYQIVVIDNNSYLEDFKNLSSLYKYENIKVVRNRQNKGFGGGHMMAIEYINADYLLFQNNDGYFLNDYLRFLLKFANKEKNIGVLGGLMYNKKKELTISFDHHPTPLVKLLGTRFLNILKKKYPHRCTIFKKSTIVDVISGASMFVKTDTFFEIGGFDPNYFLYCEEEDLCIRMNKYGLKNWIIPEAKYIHLSGQSTPKKWVYEREFYISFLYYYKKNYTFISFKIMQIFISFKLLKRSFKHPKKIKLFLFVLMGASSIHSLKHVQKIRF